MTHSKKICILLIAGSIAFAPKTEALSFSLPKIIATCIMQTKRVLTRLPAQFKAAISTKRALLTCAAMIATYAIYKAFPKVRSFFFHKKQTPITKEISDTLDILPPLPADAFGYLQAHLLAPGSRLIAIGDLHGDLQSLQNNIADMQRLGYIGANLRLQSNYHLVITGDLADRGPKGIAVWQTAMQLKKLNPQQVHIIRGNHETREIATRYGFLDELRARFGDQTQGIFDLFNRLFNRLPHAICFGFRNQQTQQIEYVMCCHGGIENRLDQQFRTLLDRATTQGSSLVTFDLNAQNSSEEPICALNWGDYTAYENSDPQEMACRRTDGNGAYTHNKAFAANYLSKFSTTQHRICCIVRGHDHIPGGVTELLPQQVAPTTTFIPEPHRIFRPLSDMGTEPVQPNSIFTLTSSPASLGLRVQCTEDAFAVIEPTTTGLQITPHITHRQV